MTTAHPHIRSAVIENNQPAPPEPHDDCPDAEAAEHLQALLDHLARWGAPDPLAAHLRGLSHNQRVPWTEERLSVLRERHATAHASAVRVAQAAVGVPADDTQV
jgi:hypothetical protein